MAATRIIRPAPVPHKTAPTAKQTASLRRLVAYLSGKTGIPASHVYGHGHITKSTACPGRNLTLYSLRRTLASVNAASN
jgi:hypothetical protein